MDGHAEPLESDSTAALAYQLEGSPLYAIEIAALLRGGLIGRQIPRDRAQDGLFMMQPYRRGRIPVVLVHGTASSPARWAELFNELEGDPRIRERFQFWVYLYDTGNPIGYSAGRLRAALTNTVQELDPDGKDPALRRIGDRAQPGRALDEAHRDRQRNTVLGPHQPEAVDQVDVSPATRALLQQSVFFTPLPFVERVIFISTPHHGAILAGRGLGAIAAWLVTLPGTVFGGLAEAVAPSGDEGLVEFMRRPPTAIDNMNPRNPGLRMLASIPVASRIPAHSIIAVKGDGPKEAGDDGVVAYQSARIDGVASELVVRWDHSCQGQPAVIEEIRRILLEHATVPGDRRP